MKGTANSQTIGTTVGPTTGEDGVMTEAPESMVPMAVQNELLEGRKLLESMEPQQRLAWGLEQFGESFVLTTSFGIQSAVLLISVFIFGIIFRFPISHTQLFL